MLFFGPDFFKYDCKDWKEARKNGLFQKIVYIPNYINYFSLFQHIRAYFNLVLPTPEDYSILQHITAYYILF